MNIDHSVLENRKIKFLDQFLGRRIRLRGQKGNFLKRKFFFFSKKIKIFLLLIKPFLNSISIFKKKMLGYKMFFLIKKIKCYKLNLKIILINTFFEINVLNIFML
jgi:hypothetical protein